MFKSFNDPTILFKKSQLPLLVLAFAPIFFNSVDISTLFSRNETNDERVLLLPITAQATVGNLAIKLEVSKNHLTHSVGLTHRQNIASDRGMLYLTTTDKPLTFSGKNMKFATDLIFIDRQRVVGTYSNISPCTDKCVNYSLRQQYDSVIEVKAETIDKLGIKNDTEINIAYAAERGLDGTNSLGGR
jgi:uncharacterized protein